MAVAATTVAAGVSSLDIREVRPLSKKAHTRAYLLMSARYMCM
jgi:hypothetical protein